MEKIRIRANYEFFKHPIKWLREYRYRRILERYANKTMNTPEMQEERKRWLSNALLYGGFHVNPDVFTEPTP